MSTTTLGWLDSAQHREWLCTEELRLLRFPNRVLTAHGDAAVFGADGSPVGVERSRTFDTARIAHVHGLAALRGTPGSRPIAHALLDHLAQYTGGAWPDHPERPDAPESLYTLSFVILAASTGIRVGHGPSAAMLASALTRLDEVFSEGDRALAVDRVTGDGDAGAYRGLNGNMHLTEALFAAADATGDETLTDRALAICDVVVEVAGRFDDRICEHFDADWQPLPDHNRDRPDHAFVPFGATVGHGIEWARLLAQAASRGRADLLPAAIAIFDRAVQDGWDVDGAPGFVYTTDWNGVPVVHDRFHWVAVEAVAAASVLARLTGEERFAEQYELWLDYAETHLIDREQGSWHHRLDRSHRPTGDGAKPDLYHAYQAMLIPQLPVSTSVAQAVVTGSIA